jgi:tetratricopeptide (TPR) repeat protein
MAAGLQGRPSGEQRRLLPVRVEDCQPAGLLADRVYIDLVGADEATARARLREEIARALRGPGRPTTAPLFPRTPAVAAARPRFPTALPPVWNVPFSRNPTFTGRQQELAALAGALAGGGTAAVTQVLQGGGGVGKTTLAVEYAYRYRGQFDTVWWVRAEQPATLLGDLTDLAVARGVANPEEASQQLAVAASRRWLEDHDRWLLVLDNAQAPDMPTGLDASLARVVDLLPQVVHGQVLVTSRDASWEQHAALAELEVFTPEEAGGFLLARSSGGDEQAAAAVAELLGWLPLALEQAGAYVRETRIPLATYLDRLCRFPALTVAKGRPRDRDPVDTVATTWQVSLQQIEPVPGAVMLLEVCAFLGPEEIPREVLAAHLDPPAEELDAVTEDPFALDDAVAALRRFGLVKANEQVLTVHRLLQQVVRDGLDAATASNRTSTALRLLAKVFPVEDVDDPGIWPWCEQLLPHALAAADHAEHYQIEPAVTSDLLDSMESYLHERGRFTEARSLAQRALALAERTYGPEGDIIPARLGSLAAVLRVQGELDHARTLLERALTIDEAHVGSNHPDTAWSLHNLGLVLLAQGDLDGARALHERALAILEAHLGADHLTIAASLNHLADVLREQGDLEGARTLFERALAIHKVHLGPDHPTTTWSLSNLARVLREQGDLDRARTLQERALSVREVRLGPDHPITAWSLHNLAAVLADQGDLEGARILYERALAVREVRLGPDHPITAWSLHNLAAVLHAQGDLQAARALQERALAIREAHLGADHSDTAWNLHNLAAVLQDQGDLDRARTLFERALAIREARLGDDHPDTTRTRRNLAAVVAALKNRE